MLAELRPSAGRAAAERPRVSRRRMVVGFASMVVVTAALLLWQRAKNEKVEWARNVALPEIERLAGDRSTSSEQPDLWRAYDLAADVERILPGDPRLEQLRPEFSRRLHIGSTPPSASVRARSYHGSDESWRSLGETPLDIWFPLGVSRIDVALDGRATATELVLNNHNAPDSVSVTLHQPDEIPPGMVWVSDSKQTLALPGLEGLDAEKVAGFWVDRCEVSNREYKQFIEAGGYRKPEYWTHAFADEGETLSFENAMARFVDTTGRAGPASWEAGDYSDGMENYPVSGISWYEAAAYAEFAAKQLPTVYHWNAVAFTRCSSAIVPLSNFGGKGPQAVDGGDAVHRGGALHLAGNVREWCWNETDAGQRFILGGGWSDQPYGFNDAYAQHPFDRSSINGFRCIKLAEDAPAERLARPIAQPVRDFFAETPVSDELFAHILTQYAYDRTDLNARVEYEREEDDWTRQKVSFDAAYSGTRIVAYLFLPKRVEPPYQTVVFFPGSGDIHQRSSEALRTEQVDFLVKSGRAVLYPVYHGLFERGGVIASDQPNETTAYRDWKISMERDLARSIDYLETRDDIDLERLAFYGLSMGGRMGPLMLGVEKRFRAAVLYVAGFKFQRSLPEADPFNFAPRVTLPVLMINARYDFFFPLETSQRPLYELLGTPKADKKWVVYDGGHSVPRSKLIAESLAWLDHYLGPVTK
jgi:formylglycine-generating enzyme required for sulfatase activity/dienelactone hydrolase